MRVDVRANEIVLDELEEAPVSYLASEELELPVPINEDAPLYVAIGQDFTERKKMERELQLARLYHSPAVWDLSVTARS